MTSELTSRQRLSKRASALLGLTIRKRPTVGATPYDVVLRENKMRVLRYRSDRRAPGRAPLLMVPSLINRHYVLDLMPGKSFVEWLLLQGWDVFMVDWGTPKDEDRYLSFDDICDGYLGRALRTIARTEQQPHVLGYCMGGTLAAIHAAAHPQSMRSLVALAAPVHFPRGAGILETWTQADGFDPKTLVSAFGSLHFKC
jgi:polyhydroxyalkanoate synthase subunit PhaC